MLASNSQLEFYLRLYIATYHDVVSSLSVQAVEQKRDITTISTRVRAEGISFLTRTLPSLGKSLDLSMGTGVPLQFTAFKAKAATQLPELFGTLFGTLFNVDGSLRVAPVTVTPSGTDSPTVEAGSVTGAVDSNIDHPSCEAMVGALRALRQLCYMFYKLNIPHTDAQEKEVCENFVSTDARLADLDYNSSEVDRVILGIARALIQRVLCNASPMSGKPKHGPGAVSTGEKPVAKHHFKRYYRRLAEKFPYDEWFFYNSSHLCDKLQEFLACEELEYGTAKVVLVPKDSRGPRLISCEPLEYQWIQQALMRVLVDTIENHRWTRGQVNFTDQTINQRLALEGSKYGNTWVTLDMKEASDRVSLNLVKDLFPEQWYDALYACRSAATQMPDGTIVQLNKFAPMGSAVCFPVEALIFWAISVASVHYYTNMPLRKAAANVFVYGDDIICDGEHHSIIGNTLERYGLLLNANKCCVAGFFRESCGMDAFLGQSVTPVRVRTTWDRRPKAGVLVSYVALHNAMYDAGYFCTADYIMEQIQEIWKWTIPVVSGWYGYPLTRVEPSCIAFVRIDATRFSDRTRARKRFNNRLQRLEVQGLAMERSAVMSSSFSWNLMLRCETERSDNVAESTSVNTAKHAPTGQYPMAHGDKLRRAWTPIPDGIG
nr:MAG: RNA replicase beta chain [Sanya steitz-like virus 2]